MSPYRRLPHDGRNTNAGYTYLGLLILIAILSVTAALTLEMADTARRRADERELLGIGREFEDALTSYGRQTPVGAKRYPATLQDLVRDPRFPGTKRHLRRVYADPLTGKPDWLLTEAPDGGIVAVSSTVEDKPLREHVTAFAAANGASAPAQSYREWRFGAAQDIDPRRLTPIFPTPPASAPLQSSPR